MALRDAPGLMAKGQAPEPTEEEVAAAILAGDEGDVELPDQPEGEQERTGDVVEALRRARRDMGYVRKRLRFSQGNTRYDYRGIDQVVNATRPVLERHGITLVPSVADYQGRDVMRSTGSRSHESTVIMEYWVFGPAGDMLEKPVRVVGQALNTSDKDAAAAQSVAMRVALVQLLHIATGDPDPDNQHIDRGAAPEFDAAAYREEALKPDTTVARIQQMQNDVSRLEVGGTMVVNETGDDESIAHLLWRVRQERKGAGGGEKS